MKKLLALLLAGTFACSTITAMNFSPKSSPTNKSPRSKTSPNTRPNKITYDAIDAFFDIWAKLEINDFLDPKDFSRAETAITHISQQAVLESDENIILMGKIATIFLTGTYGKIKEHKQLLQMFVNAAKNISTKKSY